MKAYLKGKTINEERLGEGGEGLMNNDMEVFRNLSNLISTTFIYSLYRSNKCFEIPPLSIMASTAHLP